MPHSRHRIGLGVAFGAALLAARPLAAQPSDEAAVTQAVEALRQAMLSADPFPGKIAEASCAVIGYPAALIASAKATHPIGSLSISTPSQSNRSAVIR